MNVLAIAAHPDDVELSASGTLAKLKSEGHSTYICDLTRGELGTRGSAEIRDAEAAESGKILGLSGRFNLGLADGFFEENRESLYRLIEIIRHVKPSLVLCNAVKDRHPDHARGADFAERACFLSGLPKIETQYNGAPQQAFRPSLVLHYIQDNYMEPHIVVDITGFMSVKFNSILAFKSQFYDPTSTEPQTPISSESFMEFTKAKLRQFGRYINVEFAEGFVSKRPLGVNSLTSLL